MNGIAKVRKYNLLDAIIEVAEIEFWIQRPNIFVKMTLHPNSAIELETGGFAKVSHPDEWDLEFGEDLALKKAASQMVKLAKGRRVNLGYLSV